MSCASRQLSVRQTREEPREFRYRFGIVDAGSSGSRLHIYTVEDSKSGLPLLLPAKSSSGEDLVFKSEPGLSKAGPESLEPLLLSLKKELSEKDTSNTYLFLRATAGMRLLEPEEKRKEIYKAVVAFFKKHGFRVASEDEIAFTLDASKEGVYAWLGTNYLLNRLGKDSNTVGVLDLGGASNQLNFEESDSGIQSDSIEKIFLNKTGEENRTYQVYTHSYLGYGVNEAFSKMRSEVCYSENEKEQDFEKCVDHIQSFFDRLSSEEKKHFEALQKKANLLDFYMLSAYFYTYKNLSKIYFSAFEKESNWHETMQEGAKLVCNMSVDDILSALPGEKRMHVYKLCFNASYVYTLLKNFGFTEKSNLYFVSKIEFEKENLEVGWHVGAALLEAVKLSNGNLK